DSGKSLSSTLLKLYTSFYLDFLKNSNVTIIDPLSKTILGIDNYPAYKIGYEQQYVFETWTIYNNKIYGLRYTAQLKDYPKYLPLVKIMMDSFEIGNGTNIYKNSLNTNKSYSTYRQTINNNTSDKNDLSKPRLESLKQYALLKINKDRQQFG